MKRMLCVLLCGIGAAAVAENLKIEDFVGTWALDKERSLKLAKEEDPEYSERTPVRMSKRIDRMMNTRRVVVSETELVDRFGEMAERSPLTVLSSDAETLTAKVVVKGVDTTVVFRRIDGEYMNWRSSATGRMHYYVWRKTNEVTKAEDASTAAEPEPVRKDKPEVPLKIQVLADGTYRSGGVVMDQHAMQEFVRERKQAAVEDDAVMISAHPDSKHEALLLLLDELQQNGMGRVTVAAQDVE